jgi:predicted SAM-dependent methyltransferase
MTTAEFAYHEFPKKLNLGCGFDHRQGYINIDFQEFHNPDLIADITKLSMLPDDYYEEIVAQDVLEHIERTKTLTVLVEWNRLLRCGGILILRVPNLIGLLELFKHTDFVSPGQQENLVQCLFGTQAYSGDFHLTGFTEILLRHYLVSAGFELQSLKAKDRWLFDATAIKIGPPKIPSKNNTISQRDAGLFLKKVYKKYLNREPDPQGMQFWSEKLVSGELSTEEVDATIARISN